MLDASQRNEHVPPLAAWSLGVGIVATLDANPAHGLGHGPMGALVPEPRKRSGGEQLGSGAFAFRVSWASRYG